MNKQNHDNPNQEKTAHGTKGFLGFGYKTKNQATGFIG